MPNEPETQRAIDEIAAILADAYVADRRQRMAFAESGSGDECLDNSTGSEPLSECVDGSDANGRQPDRGARS